MFLIIMIIYQNNCFFLREIQSNANSMTCSNFAATRCQDRSPTDKASVLKHKLCAYQGVKMCVFRKFWRALFSWNTRFEIPPFALLRTKYQTINTLQIIFSSFKTIWKDLAYYCKKALISGVLNHVLWVLCHVTLTLVSAFWDTLRYAEFCDVGSYFKSSSILSLRGLKVLRF